MSEHMNRLKDQMRLPHQHRSSRCLGRPLGQRSDCTSSLVKFFSIMNQSIKPKKVVSVTLSMKQLCPRKISLLELNFLSGYVARALSGCGHCWARGFKQLLRILHLAVSMLGKSASKTTLRLLTLLFPKSRPSAGPGALARGCSRPCRSGFMDIKTVLM